MSFNPRFGNRSNGYTADFNDLLALAHEFTDVRPALLYKRVAIYVGRVMMAQTMNTKTENRKDSPITDKIDWAPVLITHKDRMLKHILRVNNREWKLIKKAMFEYAEKTAGSDIWKRNRMGMATELETLREFHKH